MAILVLQPPCVIAAFYYDEPYSNDPIIVRSFIRFCQTMLEIEKLDFKGFYDSENS